MSFAQDLQNAAQKHGQLCVGIDPHAQLLNDWGLTDDVDGLASFSDICVEAFAGHVAVVKPQVAFYERFGSAGFTVLEELIQRFRDAKTLVIADAKRGDIGSTMQGYADAWLRPGSPLEVDAVTLTPFLGVGSLAPAIETAHEHGKGVFVMAANSNPEAQEFQSKRIDGTTIAQSMVDACEALSAEYRSDASHTRLGDVGIVVGATISYPLDFSSFTGPVLMPGVGAQGASFSDVRSIAGQRLEQFYPNMSRGILAAGPDRVELRKRAVDLANWK